MLGAMKLLIERLCGRTMRSNRVGEVVARSGSVIGNSTCHRLRISIAMLPGTLVVKMSRCLKTLGTKRTPR